MAKKRARLLYQALIDGLSYVPNNVIEADAELVEKLEGDGIADAELSAVEYCLDKLGETVKDHDSLLLEAIGPDGRHALVVKAIESLDPNSEELWTDGGLPQVKALAVAAGFEISADQRDLAWQEVCNSRSEQGEIVE